MSEQPSVTTNRTEIMSSPTVATDSNKLSAQNHVNLQVGNEDIVAIRMSKIHKAIRQGLSEAESTLARVNQEINKTDRELSDQVSKMSAAQTCKAPTITEADNSPFNLTTTEPEGSCSFDRNAPAAEQWTIRISFELHQGGKRIDTITHSWKKEAPDVIKRIYDRLVSLENRRAEIKQFITKLQAERANSAEYRDEARADIALNSLKQMDQDGTLGDLLSKYEDGSFKMPDSLRTLPV